LGNHVSKREGSTDTEGEAAAEAALQFLQLSRELLKKPRGSLDSLWRSVATCVATGPSAEASIYMLTCLWGAWEPPPLQDKANPQKFKKRKFKRRKVECKYAVPTAPVEAPKHP
jgi:hypothetical protein